MTSPSILEAQNITPTCRTGRGDDGAWDEAVARLREIYDAQVAHDPSVTLALAIFRGDFRAAQLATALAQPDTLGDGGGVPVVRTDFASASDAMGALGDPLCPMPKTWVIVAEDFDSEAPLEYTPEAMEHVRSGTFFAEFQPDDVLTLAQPSATSERGEGR